MKKTGFVILLSVLTSSAYGQQFLWSTAKDTTATWERLVSLNNVTKEVLNFYDQYNAYYDFSGYSKERFIKDFDYGFDEWKWLNGVNDLTVFALKSNTGQGSIIIVMCVSRKNVNAIIFSNAPLQSHPKFTIQSDREKFAGWFKTLLN